MSGMGGGERKAIGRHIGKGRQGRGGRFRARIPCEGAMSVGLVAFGYR